jgi:hypothetical protein
LLDAALVYFLRFVRPLSSCCSTAGRQSLSARIVS